LPPKDADYTALAFSSLASLLGCGNSSDRLACMRSQPTSALLSGQQNISSGFSPTVNGKIVFSNYPARASAGNFIRKPLLICNTDYEAGLFQTIITVAGGAQQPVSSWDIFNDTVFNCPAAARANFSLANHVPTWPYRWFGNFGNTRLTSYPDSGAYHAFELPVLFGNFPSRGGVLDSTPEEVAIGSYPRGAWAAFAKKSSVWIKHPQWWMANIRGAR